MKVIEIRGYHVGYDVSPPIGNARGWIRRREVLLVEVITDSGLRGWGEAFSSPHAAAAVIQTRLAPVVLGQSPHDHRRLWERMIATHGYDRRGASMMAVSALDLALHDLAAQERGISVAALLGGALHQRLLAYASGPFIAEGPAPYGHYAGTVDRLLAEGWRALKPRAGFGPREDGEMATALRRQAGPDIGLMVDINQGYTARAAIDSAHRMAEAGLLWIEEPVMPEDIDGYATVAAAVPTAIAGGEALGSLAAFRDMLAARTLSIVQPDLAVCGGYTGFLRIATLCAAYDLPVMPHCFGTVVSQRAALQAAALLPSCRGGGPAPYPFVEYDITDNPLLALQGPAALDRDGMVAIPDAPGTGLELTAERLAPWLAGTWQCRAP